MGEEKAPPQYNPMELPALKMLRTDLDPELDYFPAIVSVKSKLKSISSIEENLSSEELKIFKNSCFGHYLNMSTEWAYCGVLTHYLLLRQIKTKKQNEMWFKAEGKPARFGMTEFALTTGLNCRKLPSHKTLEKEALSGSEFLNRVRGKKIKL